MHHHCHGVLLHCIVRQHHERVCSVAQWVYAQLHSFVQFELIKDVAIRVEDKLLGKNVRVLVVLQVSIKGKAVLYWMHTTTLVCDSASCLRGASQQHTRVPQRTWRVYLQIVSIGSAQNAWVLPINLLLVIVIVVRCLGRRVHHLIATGLVMIVVNAWTIPVIASKVVLRYIAHCVANCWNGRANGHHFTWEYRAIRQLAYLFLLSVLDFCTKRRHLWRFLHLHLLCLVLVSLCRMARLAVLIALTIIITGCLRHRLLRGVIALLLVLLSLLIFKACFLVVCELVLWFLKHGSRLLQLLNTLGWLIHGFMNSTWKLFQS